MQIDKRKCVGCANCVPVCPVGAISIGADSLAEINTETCVECHNCYRSLSYEHLPPSIIRPARRLLKKISLRFQPEPDVCPTEAFNPDELEWPRIVRRAFSDPMVTHESTGVHGRGTEEVKTNDVSHRVAEGDVGFVVEFGRPGVGVYFCELQKATQGLAGAGVAFEKGNPVTNLMSEVATGAIRSDLWDEKVLSCIVEFKAQLQDVPRLLRQIADISSGLDTVVSVGVSTVCGPHGEDALRDLLLLEGYGAWRAKVNLGLGRATNRLAETKEISQ